MALRTDSRFLQGLYLGDISFLEATALFKLIVILADSAPVHYICPFIRHEGT
jgi:hypothetical protein